MIANSNFIAIDFETSNQKHRPCQIGIAVVKNGIIVDLIMRYIKPPKNDYNPYNIKIHGIKPEMTKNAPSFDVIWSEIKHLFEGNFIVAHNASFDMSVLNKTLDFYNITPPRIMGYACTYKIFNEKLDNCCRDYGIELNNHHDGICDAEACAKLFLAYLNGCEIKEFIHDMDSMDIIRNDVKTKISIHPFEEIETGVTTPIPEIANRGFLVSGETVFDREDLYRFIKAVGGIPKSSVTSKLHYLILGENPGPMKIEKAKVLIEGGHDLKVMTESEFLEFISTLRNLKELSV